MPGSPTRSALLVISLAGCASPIDGSEGTAADRARPAPPPAAGLPGAPSWILEGTQRASALGYTVGSIGDVNGDGYDDVFVSAPNFDAPKDDMGEIYVYHGSATGLAPAPAWVKTGSERREFLGIVADGAGDVNGDGYDDLLLLEQVPGAYIPYYGSGAPETLVTLYFGSPAGLAAAPGWTSQGAQAGEVFGGAVHGVGDINGDGFDDIAIGAPLYTRGEEEEGKIYVFRGSPTGPGAVAEWTYESNLPGVRLSLAMSAGDVDGDGIGDLAVAMPQANDLELWGGRVEVFHGTPLGLESSPRWTVAGDAYMGQLGNSFGAAGDVNGDGYGDLFATERGWSSGGLGDQGRVHVHLGSPTGLEVAASWIVEGPAERAWLGWSADAAGDVNGDGFDDLVVSRLDENAGDPNLGAALLFLGSPAGLPLVADWVGEDACESGWYGDTVAGIGDVNGDFVADFLVTNPDCDAVKYHEGRVHAYHGVCGQPDADGDGFSCGDCGDADVGVFPGAPEVPDDGIDQDCDGADTVTPPIEDTDVPDTDLPDTDEPDTDAPDTDAADTDAGGGAPDEEKGGCSSTGTTTPWLALVGLLLARRRRWRPRTPPISGP